jgi:hypothetical protein
MRRDYECLHYIVSIAENKGVCLDLQFAAYGTSQTASHSSSSEQERVSPQQRPRETEAFAPQTTFRMTAPFLLHRSPSFTSNPGSANPHFSVPVQPRSVQFSRTADTFLQRPTCSICGSCGYGKRSRFRASFGQNCTFHFPSSTYGTCTGVGNHIVNTKVPLEVSDGDPPNNCRGSAPMMK